MEILSLIIYSFFKGHKCMLYFIKIWYKKNRISIKKNMFLGFLIIYLCQVTLIFNLHESLNKKTAFAIQYEEDNEAITHNAEEPDDLSPDEENSESSVDEAGESDDLSPDEERSEISVDEAEESDNLSPDEESSEISVDEAEESDDLSPDEERSEISVDEAEESDDLLVGDEIIPPPENGEDITNNIEIMPFADRSVTAVTGTTYDIGNLGIAASDDLTIVVNGGVTNVTITGSRTGTGFTYIAMHGISDVTLRNVQAVNNNTNRPFILADGGTAATSTVIIQGTNTISNALSNYPCVSATLGTNLIVKGYTPNSQANYLNVTGYTTGIGSYMADAGNISVSDLTWTSASNLNTCIGTYQGTAKNLTVRNISIKGNTFIRAGIGTYNGQVNDINVADVEITSTAEMDAGVGGYCNNAAGLNTIINSITADHVTIKSGNFISSGIGCYYYAGPLARVTNFIQTNYVTITASTYIAAGIGAASNVLDHPEYSFVGNLNTNYSVINADTINTGIGGYLSNNSSIYAENSKITANTHMRVGIGNFTGNVLDITANNAELSVAGQSSSTQAGIGTRRSVNAGNIYLLGTIDVSGSVPLLAGYSSTTVYGNVYIDSGNIKQVNNNAIVANPAIVPTPVNSAGEPLACYLLQNFDSINEYIEPYQTYPDYVYSANKSTNNDVLFSQALGLFLPDRYLLYMFTPEDTSVVSPLLKEITIAFPQDIQLEPNAENNFQLYKVGSGVPLQQAPATVDNNGLTLHLLEDLEEYSTYTLSAPEGLIRDLAIGYRKNAALPAGEYTFTTKNLGSLQLVAQEELTFGRLPLSSLMQTARISPEDLDIALYVIDDREIKSTWKLYVQVNQVLYNDKYNSYLPDALIYRKDGIRHVLSGAKTQIFEYINEDDNPFSISDTWYKAGDEGLFVDVKPGEGFEGQYRGSIEWIVEYTP